MESTMNDNLDVRYKKLWRRKQVQEEQADKKVSAIMLLGFVMAKGHDESTRTSEELGDTLF